MTKVVNDAFNGRAPISDDEIKAMYLSQVETEAAQSPKLDFPTEIIDLPSRGQFYPEGHPLSSGKIELKYMTAREEDILSSASLIKQGVVLDKLLQALIVTKVKFDEILLMDKNAIFIAARVLAYGNDYGVELECPSCGVKHNEHIDLSSFEEKEVDWSGFTPGQTTFDFELPVSKKKLALKFLTQGDEKAISEDLKAAKKVSKFTGVDPELTTRLKYMIASVDGNTDKTMIAEFAKNMLSRDSLALREYLKKVTPDIDTTFAFDCNSCDYENLKMAVPITVQFFWPGA
jgi:hypothetical protein